MRGFHRSLAHFQQLLSGIGDGCALDDALCATKESITPAQTFFDFSTAASGYHLALLQARLEAGGVQAKGC